ncbi:hypothetical protein HO133_011045 [Letharia lupina]|uniref:Uncharacterized protein n=1 Tax=Letharia lupina TaxID=560253 RepID=A0A8H6CJ64_9LECA|nr:uncharacterized protein HO133_011045 [Letharia lupina]KAF6224468.1 hypothetical protein HO133_011045 [Letharia lupina]
MLILYDTTEQLSRRAAEKQRTISAANSKRWTDHKPLVGDPTDDTGALNDKPTTGELEDSSSQDDKQAKDEDLTPEASRTVSAGANFHARTHPTRPGRVTASLSLCHHETIAKRHPPSVSERELRSSDS